MNIISTNIFDVFILEPKVFNDVRGFFLESWNKKNFKNLTKIDTKFVQDNHSRSQKGVLRGLHYQLTKPQGKLVRVTQGKVLDVIVDLRKSSSTFGKHVAVELSDKNHKQILAPAGCAHGFLVLSKSADFIYKTTEYYAFEDEHSILWNDPDLNIDWQLDGIKPKLSTKDKQAKSFKDAPKYD